MDFPIVVMSFNRPEYLEQVLRSLKAQSGVAIRDDQVHLFQDGAVSALTGKVYAKQEDIDASRRIFSDIFPGGVIHEADSNLGVALNFDRAERFVFETLNAEVAIFLEDDLVLGPFYMKTMTRLARLALAREDVGYFSAFGMHRAPPSEQRKFADRLMPMNDNWAFGLTQKQWRKSAPYVDQYLDLVRMTDYRNRPHDQIAALYASWGLPAQTSSQDMAKSLACYLTGSVKVKTYPTFGRYIGRHGVHATPKLFEEAGFHLTEPMEEDIFTKDAISDADVQEVRSKMVDFSRLGLTIAPAPHASFPVFNILCSKLPAGNPYSEFQPTLTTPQLDGWNGEHGALARLVKTTKAQIIVDVGAWLGQSTATLARAQAEVAPNGTVIAIDTFLGSPEHWSMDRPDIHPMLKFRHGRPDFYETFLSNMKLLELDRRVFPLAQTAEHAARLLTTLKITPHLIHLDASHAYEEVLRDMSLYWDLLAPGGVLMGDDFQFPGVSRAVVHFTDRLGLPYTVDFPKWWVAKPA